MARFHVPSSHDILILLKIKTITPIDNPLAIHEKNQSIKTLSMIHEIMIGIGSVKDKQIAGLLLMCNFLF